MNLRNLTRGDIVLVRTSGLVGRVIRWFTNEKNERSHWNHVGMYVGSGMMIEAVPFKTRIAPVSVYLKSGCEVMIAHLRAVPKIHLFEEGEEHGLPSQLVVKALQCFGAGYGFKTIVLQMLDNITRTGLFTRRWAKWTSPICSQIVARTYEDVMGLQFDREISWESVTPDDIGDEISNHDKRWEVVAGWLGENSVSNIEAAGARIERLVEV